MLTNKKIIITVDKRWITNKLMINKGTVIIVNKGMMINKNVNKRMVIVNADYGDVLSNKRINLMMIMSQKMTLT